MVSEAVHPEMGSISGENDIMNKIIRDEKLLAILLELGKKKRRTFNELKEELKIGEAELIDKLNALEFGAYIKQNPNKDNKKPFITRRYMIDLRGMILLNKLRIEYPEFRESFNFFF